MNLMRTTTNLNLTTTVYYSKFVRIYSAPLIKHIHVANDPEFQQNFLCTFQLIPHLQKCNDSQNDSNLAYTRNEIPINK